MWYNIRSYRDNIDIRFFSLLIKTRTFHENEPLHGPCPVVPLFLRPECDSVMALYADRNSPGEKKICEVPGNSCPQLQPSLHERGAIGSYTDVSATDGYGVWTIFIPGPSVRVRVSYIKPNLVSQAVSVGRPG